MRCDDLADRCGLAIESVGLAGVDVESTDHAALGGHGQRHHAAGAVRYRAWDVRRPPGLVGEVADAKYVARAIGVETRTLVLAVLELVEGARPVIAGQCSGTALRKRRHRCTLGVRDGLDCQPADLGEGRLEIPL